MYIRPFHLSLPHIRDEIPLSVQSGGVKLTLHPRGSTNDSHPHPNYSVPKIKLKQIYNMEFILNSVIMAGSLSKI